MIEIPNDIAVQDLAQWLSDGVVVLKNDPAMTPLFVYRIGEAGDVRVREHREGRLSEPRPVPSRDLLCGWPTCGAVNVGGIALYVQRSQIRQYRRTYNSRAVAPAVPDAREAEEFDPRQYARATHFFTYTEAVYRTEAEGYPPPERAIAMVQEPAMFSVAVSPSIIITKVPTTGDLRVWHNNELVAKIFDRATLLPLRGALPRAVKKRLGGMYADM